MLQTDWNDGLAAANLIKSKGGPMPGFSKINSYPENWVSNLDTALRGGKKLGVMPVMDARDMASTNVEYLGVMAWVAQFQWLQGGTPPGDKLEVSMGNTKMRVGEEVIAFYIPNSFTSYNIIKHTA